MAHFQKRHSEIDWVPQGLHFCGLRPSKCYGWYGRCGPALQGGYGLVGKVMPRTLPQHPSKTAFHKGPELERTFRVIRFLWKPYLEAHDVKQNLPLKLESLRL